MSERCLLGLRGFVELLERELPQRLEHEEPRLADRLEEALVDERRDRVEIGARDGGGGVEREAAAEDREPTECDSLRIREQVVAPLDRVPQGLLPLRRVARAAGQEWQRLFKPLEDRTRREQLRACGGELDC